MLHAKKLQTHSDWSAYEGWKLEGYPETIILHGQVIVEDYNFAGPTGTGRFVERKPFGSL